MRPKIYPCFSSEDIDHLHGLIGMIKNKNNVLSGIPIQEQENLEGNPPEVVKVHLRPKIKQSDIMVLLLGKNTHSRRWVRYEIEVAQSFRIPIFAVRIPESNIGGLPSILKGKVSVVNWNIREIQSMIDRLVKK